MARSAIKREPSRTTTTVPVSSETRPDALSSSISDDSDDEGDPNISRPVEVTASESTTAMDGDTAVRVSSVDHSLLSGGYRSLSSIALHGLGLGVALGGCIQGTIYLALHGYKIWRLPEFVATLALFHFLEFYTTARWNTANAKVSSYLLLSNGLSYNLAQVAAVLEILVSSLFFPNWQAALSTKYTIGAGVFLVVVGQVVRSVAMAQAGKSFNHIPQRRKREDHVLVTSGIYSWLRHPSYFGYYWYAVGTQVVVGNKICAVLYAVVLWLFFHARIPDEEQYLIEFFGKDYVDFKERVGTGIPFIR